jgi:choline kinase
LYDEFIKNLSSLEDEIYNKKTQYIQYFKAIQFALSETNVNKLVDLWTQVDVEWMEIDTPVQPGHFMEYYEDKYRRAVAIEFDVRLSDPSLFSSNVSADIENMYE